MDQDHEPEDIEKSPNNQFVRLDFRDCFPHHSARVRQQGTKDFRDPDAWFPTNVCLHFDPNIKRVVQIFRR